jgi:hypothetical protein
VRSSLGINIPVTLADLQPVPAGKAKPASDQIAAVVADVIKRPSARPRRLKKLSSISQALFQKQLGDDELRELLDALIHCGVGKVSDGKLSYELPNKPRGSQPRAESSNVRT